MHRSAKVTTKIEDRRCPSLGQVSASSFLTQDALSVGQKWWLGETRRVDEVFVGMALFGVLVLSGASPSSRRTLRAHRSLRSFDGPFPSLFAFASIPMIGSVRSGKNRRPPLIIGGWGVLLGVFPRGRAAGEHRVESHDKTVTAR